MTYHFEQILKEKGYKITQNKNKSNHKLNEKKLKADVQNNIDNKIERIQNDTESSLSESEKKLKDQMKKRSELLHVELDNEDFKDEITDDRMFVNHLNISTLLMKDIDEKLIDKSYRECRVNNVKGNIMKIKLIKQLENKLGFKNSLTIDYDTDKARFNENIKLDDKYIKCVRKTFRSKKDPITFKDSYDLLMTLYKNVCRGIVSSKKTRCGDQTYYKYSIDKDKIKSTLDLISHRNKKLSGYNCDVYSYKLAEVKPSKKMF